MKKWFSGKRKVLYGAIAFVLAGGMVLSAVLGFGLSGTLSGEGKQVPQRPADEIIAHVNDEDIKWHQLEVQLEHVKQQYRNQGIDIESQEMQQMIPQLKEHLLQDIIANIIIMKEAEKEGIKPQEDNIEKRYQQFVEQYGGEEEKILQDLEAAGFTKEDLKEDIAKELTIQEYTNFAISEYREEEIVISEEEKRDLFEQYSVQVEALEYEEVEHEIEEMLKQERKQEMMAEIIEELKEDYEIEIFI